MAEIRIPASKGWASFQANRGDVVLFERGGVFKRNTKGVFSGGVRYGCYGDSTKPLPVVQAVAAGVFIEVDGAKADATDITVEDIDFDFEQAKYRYGIHLMNFKNITLRRVRIRNTRGVNLSVEPYGGRRNVGFTLVNSVIEYAYPENTTVHSQGFYMAGTDNWKVVGNVFDANGYRPGLIAGSVYNHNAYLQGDNGDAGEFSKNFSSRASSHGVQLRAGGDAGGNVFWQNAIGMSYGLVNRGVVKAGGVTGVVKNNAFVGGPPLSGQIIRGWGIEIGNPKLVSVRNNLFFNGTVSSGTAIEVKPCDPPESCTKPTKTSLSLVGNYVWKWAGPELKLNSGDPAVVRTPVDPPIQSSAPTIDYEVIKQRVLQPPAATIPAGEVDDGSGGTLDMSTVLRIELVDGGEVFVNRVKAIYLKGKVIPTPTPAPVDNSPSVKPFFDACGVPLE